MEKNPNQTLRTGGIAASRDYQNLPAWTKAMTLAEKILRQTGKWGTGLVEGAVMDQALLNGVTTIANTVGHPLAAKAAGSSGADLANVANEDEMKKATAGLLPGL